MDEVNHPIILHTVPANNIVSFRFQKEIKCCVSILNRNPKRTAAQGYTINPHSFLCFKTKLPDLGSYSGSLFWRKRHIPSSELASHFCRFGSKTKKSIMLSSIVHFQLNFFLPNLFLLVTLCFWQKAE